MPPSRLSCVSPASCSWPRSPAGANPPGAEERPSVLRIITVPDGTIRIITAVIITTARWSCRPATARPTTGRLPTDPRGRDRREFGPRLCPLGRARGRGQRQDRSRVTARGSGGPFPFATTPLSGAGGDELGGAAPSFPMGVLGFLADSRMATGQKQRRRWADPGADQTQIPGRIEQARIPAFPAGQ
jgi:hypothetical protein